MPFTPPGNWATLNDDQRIAAIAASPDCTAMNDQQIADYINATYQVGSGVLLPTTVQAVIDFVAAKGQTGWAQIEAALVNAATTAAVKAVKRMLQFPATMIPSDQLAAAAAAMQAAGLLIAADVTALQAQLTTYKSGCLLRDQPAGPAPNGMGWIDPTQTMTAARVFQAIGH